MKKTIKKMLDLFPCVCIIGARQVGKSTLLKEVMPKAKFYDLEKAADYEYISKDPDLFLSDNSSPLIIDESQLCPNLFPALRVAIDEKRNQTGRFLISGSSSPQLLKNISESLAGRIATIEIPTFTWQEALERKKSKFYSCLSNPDQLNRLKPNYERKELYELCFYGLYPEAFLKRKNKVFHEQWHENYIKNYLERDIRSLFPDLQLENYRRLVSMLAHSSGDLIKASVFASSLDVSEPTVKRYLEIAEGTFIWERLKSYNKNTKKRLVKMPKGYIKDSSIVNHILNIDSVDTLISHPKFGHIWESFVIEQIQKNLKEDLVRFDAYYYRTNHKAEIDLILEIGQKLIPIEVKSGSVIKKDQLYTMKNFIEEYNCEYGLVINNGDEIRRVAENIYQIPTNYL